MLTGESWHSAKPQSPEDGLPSLTQLFYLLTSKEKNIPNRTTKGYD